jgi:hypothetical protein
MNPSFARADATSNSLAHQRRPSGVHHADRCANYSKPGYGSLKIEGLSYEVLTHLRRWDLSLSVTGAAKHT